MKNKKEIRKLRKISSYTYTIVIPKNIVDKYGWKEKQKLTIEDKGSGKLEIKDWRKK